MKTTNDGGPAFPTVARDGNWQPHHDGLSLRDYFAGQALAGMPWSREISRKDQAKQSFQIADSMLAAREGKP
jgi:hypothetical protein